MTGSSVDEMHVLRRIRVDLGGLVEVMVAGTVAGDWVSAMTALSDSGFDVHFFDAEESLSIPLDPDLFIFDEDSPYAVRIRAGDQVWTGSLHDPGVISFQCEADQFRTVQDVRNVERLMSVVRAAVGKDAILVPESAYPGQLPPYLTVRP